MSAATNGIYFKGNAETQSRKTIPSFIVYNGTYYFPRSQPTSETTPSTFFSTSVPQMGMQGVTIASKPPVKERIFTNMTFSSEPEKMRVGLHETQPIKKKSRRARRTAAKVMNLVCQHCGVTSTPEWRRGPLGLKTLCNACGLQYAKRRKIQRSGNLKDIMN